MPPRAIPSHAASTRARASLDPVRAWWRRRNSNTIAAGNFGARPNPPLTGSAARPSRVAASATVCRVIGSAPPGATCARTAAMIWVLLSRTASRRSAQAAVTASSRPRNWALGR